MSYKTEVQLHTEFLEFVIACLRDELKKSRSKSDIFEAGFSAGDDIKLRIRVLEQFIKHRPSGNQEAIEIIFNMLLKSKFKDADKPLRVIIHYFLQDVNEMVVQGLRSHDSKSKPKKKSSKKKSTKGTGKKK